MFQRRVIRRSVETCTLRLESISATAPQVQYQLKRSSARRTLAMRISADGEITVNAPFRIAESHIQAFLLDHADWLRERLDAQQAPKFIWQQGMPLPWLGHEITLNWQPTHLGKPRLQCGQLDLGGDWATVPAQVMAAYHQSALPYFQDRLTHHAQRMGVDTPPLRLSNARTRWGSLSPKGGVSLNWRLFKAPAEVIDYVICHELAHLRQRNHAPAFWREVAALFPNHAKARRDLKAQGKLYFQF